MTKLQYLNSYVTERLMRTAEEILQVVAETLSEFQEEISRAKSENQYLKRQLLAASKGRGQACSQTLWFANIPPPPEEQHDELVDIPTVWQQNLLPLQTKDEPKLRIWKEEEETQEPPFDTDDRNIQRAFCGDADDDNSIAQPSQPNHITYSETEECDTQITDQIKTEPFGDDPHRPISAHNTEPLPPITAHCSRTGNKCHENILQNEQDTNEKKQEEHFLVHSNSNNDCTVRQQSFPSPKYLKRHMQSHIKQIASRCGVCGKSLSSYGKLKEHQRLHTGERPFSCEFCGKRFNQNCNLKVHLRVHTGEKPYPCPVCGKGFSQSSQVKVHLRTHR